jgi:rhodanese-related sulfurtransferase
MLPLEIDVLSVKKMLEGGEKFMLLDVREPAEVTTARIAGSVQIPMRDIPARLAELESRKGERIVVHCHHGGRSQRVTHYLRQQGFTQVQNMSGGIDDWSLKVDSTVPRYDIDSRGQARRLPHAREPLAAAGRRNL